MRHLQLRCMHRAAERRVGQELLRARRPGRRRRHHHDRGARERGVGSAAARLPRGARAAVRLLHARDDHRRRRPAPREPAPDHAADPRRPRGQPVPLHRLREHRPCRAARRRRDGAGGSDVMTAQTETQAPELGRARPRKEDARLVTGQTNWTDNIVLPGMLHMAFLRSPYAHAKITSVDVSAAKELPGVIAAFTGADFADEQGSLPCAWPVTEDIVIPNHPPMAVDEVRYVGEAVAVVVARDRYTAADALAGTRI